MKKFRTRGGGVTDLGWGGAFAGRESVPHYMS